MKRSAFKSRGNRALPSATTRASEARPAKIAPDRQAALDTQARKITRRIERLLTTAGTDQVETTEWENEFLSSLKERVVKYGRAFCDPEKGNLAAPLSVRQAIKVRQIQASVRKQLARSDSEQQR